MAERTSARRHRELRPTARLGSPGGLGTSLPLAESGCFALADGGPPGTYCYCFGGRKGNREIRFNLTPGEFVGGPRDGEVAIREFALDV